MTRFHYRKQSSRRATGRRGPALGKAGVRLPDHQGKTIDGPRQDTVQGRLDRWKAGADALEVKFAKKRAQDHRFVPMGTLPSCEICGVGVDARREDGTRIHL